MKKKAAPWVDKGNSYEFVGFGAGGEVDGKGDKVEGFVDLRGVWQAGLGLSRRRGLDAQFKSGSIN